MLDTDPRLAAQAHIDRHVVKMLIEYAQILSTVHHIWDDPNHVPIEIYKATHKNHPSVKWAAQSRAEYNWLRELWVELHIEYMHRYGDGKKDPRHASFKKLHAPLWWPPFKMPSVPSATAAPYMAKQFQAVGPDYKQLNPVEAYREYYRKTKQFDAKGKPMAKWTKRGKPDWF
jgi:hypothetical protein